MGHNWAFFPFFFGLFLVYILMGKKSTRWRTKRCEIDTPSFSLAPSSLIFLTQWATVLFFNQNLAVNLRESPRKSPSQEWLCIKTHKAQSVHYIPHLSLYSLRSVDSFLRNTPSSAHPRPSPVRICKCEGGLWRRTPIFDQIMSRDV